jgi:long-subunit acyl-CoA synthetase (AMP-forming)
MQFEGYWNNAEATAEAFAPGGWFKTGDLAVWASSTTELGPRPYLQVVDRAKDMVSLACSASHHGPGRVLARLSQQGGCA